MTKSPLMFYLYAHSMSSSHASGVSGPFTAFFPWSSYSLLSFQCPSPSIVAKQRTHRSDTGSSFAASSNVGSGLQFTVPLEWIWRQVQSSL